MSEIPPNMSESPQAPADAPDRLVRDGLRCLQLSGAIFLRAHFSAPWAYESPPSEQIVAQLKPGDRRVILFHIFTEGSCRIRVGSSGDVTQIEAGDIAIFPFADQHRVGDPSTDSPVTLAQLMPPPPWNELPVIRFGKGGAPTSMVCGYLYCDDLPFNPVLASLPPVIRVRPAGGPLAEWVDASIKYALRASEARADDDPLMQRLPELLFIECLCEYATRQRQADNGWLAGLADPIVGRALAAVHRHPEQAWTLNDLAKHASTSRSVLDERFRVLLGQAPMSYVSAWRLQLASRKLRTSNATLAEIADAIGYGSEASFSRAFKRHVGVAPSEWRARP